MVSYMYWPVSKNMHEYNNGGVLKFHPQLYHHLILVHSCTLQSYNCIKSTLFYCFDDTVNSQDCLVLFLVVAMMFYDLFEGFSN